MKRYIGFGILSLAIVLLGGFSTASHLSQGAVATDSLTYLPLVVRNSGYTHGLIVADHTHTDLSAIPQAWIEQAKSSLRLFYAHTSHGSQPVSGMQVLMNNAANNHLYDFTSDGSIVVGKLSLDNRGDVDLGHSGDTYWVELTRDYLDGEGSDRNVVIWSWCGGVSDNTPEGIITYLSAMEQLELEYPLVTFVYMTGHLDGSGVDGNLNQMNNLIRDFVMAHNKVLFDFADIESYNPDGDEFLSRFALDSCIYDGNGNDNPWDDTTNWATEWCAANVGDARCLACIDCAHSEDLNCNLKARAFWWMLARIAGWSGS